MWDAEIDGLEVFQNDLDDALYEIHNGTERGVRLAVDEGAADARRLHRFENHTGMLEQSIQGTWIGWKGDRAEGLIKAYMKYASWVDAGTRPHIIPGNPTLFFFWKKVNAWVRFTLPQVVHHPGTKAQPFMHFAFYKAERVIQREIEISIVAAQGILNR